MGRIVVVGAGIAPLGPALFLARDGHEVTVCEIDGPPPPGIDELWSDWPRPNVPQGRLGHAVLAGFCAELQARAPDVLQSILDAGAVVDDVSEQAPEGQREPGDEQLIAVMCRRPVLEGIMRRAVEAEPSVTIRCGLPAGGRGRRGGTTSHRHRRPAGGRRCERPASLSVRLDGGAGEMDRLGRVARSQQVLPCLFTQRVTDALNARLEGYISRLAIRPITDPDEARAAYQLAKRDTNKYLERITTPGTIGGSSQTCETPNWKSMRALRDPVTRELLRGAVFLYKDLHERAIPVEVVLPEEFVHRASTNPAEISARRSR